MDNSINYFKSNHQLIFTIMKDYILKQHLIVLHMNIQYHGSVLTSAEGSESRRQSFLDSHLPQNPHCDTVHAAINKKTFLHKLKSFERIAHYFKYKDILD